jgi:hypothetical protein
VNRDRKTFKEKKENGTTHEERTGWRKGDFSLPLPFVSLRSSVPFSFLLFYSGLQMNEETSPQKAHKAQKKPTILPFAPCVLFVVKFLHM